MSFGEERLNITDNLDFFARQVVEGFLTGMHKSPYHGFSVEFAEHRAYNSGDSIKNIDWKLFARSNKLFVKKFEEETNLRSHLLIDISSSMFYPDQANINKIKFSIYAAACLIYLFRKQRDGFGLTCFSDKLDFFSRAKNTKAHYNRLMSELDKLLHNDFPRQNENRKTDFSKIVSELIEKTHERSLIIIFSDMMHSDQSYLDNLFQALQHLRYKKNEVILFHVQDYEKENLFKFSNRPYRFVDLESQSEIKLNPVNYKDIYQTLYAEFQEKIKTQCNQYKIDYIPSFIQEGFSSVLISYLTKRSKLF